MNENKFLTEKRKENLAQTISSFTLMLQTILGVVIFLIWTTIAEWDFIRKPAREPLLFVQNGLLIFVFLLTFLIVGMGKQYNPLHPLSEKVSQFRKVFLAVFLSLLTIGVINLVSVLPTYQYKLGNLYPLATISYLTYMGGSYLGGSYVNKEEIKSLLDSTSVDNFKDSINQLIRKKRPLSKKVCDSLVVSLLTWGIGLGIWNYWISNGKYLHLLVEYGATFTFILVFGFVLFLGLAKFLKFIIKRGGSGK